MAASNSGGYNCQFADATIQPELYCKKCSLVARDLVVTSCCGENFCAACVSGISVCPDCKSASITTLKLVKLQNIIKNLRVFCDRREKGCSWCDQLHLLEDHKRNCGYIESTCPLGCTTVLLQNFVDRHVSSECPLRRISCHHCQVEVLSKDMDAHVANNCEQVHIMCPNNCGTSYKRAEEGIHKAVCPEEMIKCEFNSMGCKGTFKRKNEGDHSRIKQLKHLEMVAKAVKKGLRGAHTAGGAGAAAANKVDNAEVKKLKKDLHAMKETCDKQKHIIDKMREDLAAFKNSWDEQRKLVIDEHDKRLTRLEELNDEWNNSNIDDKKLIKSESDPTAAGVKAEPIDGGGPSMEVELQSHSVNFTVTDFSIHKARDRPNGLETSPMYTHPQGYQFSIGIDANGFGDGRGKSIRVWIKSLPGEHDEHLKWPAKINFTVVLKGNRPEVPNWVVTNTMSWIKPTNKAGFCQCFSRDSSSVVFISHDMLGNYLRGDSLEFKIFPAVNAPQKS